MNTTTSKSPRASRRGRLTEGLDLIRQLAAVESHRRYLRAVAVARGLVLLVVLESRSRHTLAAENLFFAPILCERCMNTFT